MLFSSASTVTEMRPPVPTRRRKSAPRRESPRHSRSAALAQGATRRPHREGERAAELQGPRQQHRGGRRLTEQFAHGWRVIGMRAQLTPCAFQAHPVAAHRPFLEYEATHLVAHRDSGLIHQPPSLRRSSSFNCAGLALPAVAFITWPTKNPNNLSLPAR